MLNSRPQPLAELMGQLRWSQNRVLMLEFQRIAKNNKIRPNTMFLRSISTEIHDAPYQHIVLELTACFLFN